MKYILIAFITLLTWNVSGADTSSGKAADTAKFNWNNVYKDAKEGLRL